MYQLLAAEKTNKRAYDLQRQLRDKVSQMAQELDVQQPTSPLQLIQRSTEPTNKSMVLLE